MDCAPAEEAGASIGRACGEETRRAEERQTKRLDHAQEQEGLATPAATEGEDRTVIVLLAALQEREGS